MILSQNRMLFIGRCWILGRWIFSDCPHIYLKVYYSMFSDIESKWCIVTRWILDILEVIVLFSTSNLRVKVEGYCLQSVCYSSRDIGHILFCNLDIEMRMNATGWSDIMFQGDDTLRWWCYFLMSLKYLQSNRRQAPDWPIRYYRLGDLC